MNPKRTSFEVQKQVIELVRIEWRRKCCSEELPELRQLPWSFLGLAARAWLAIGFPERILIRLCNAQTSFRIAFGIRILSTERSTIVRGMSLDIWPIRSNHQVKKRWHGRRITATGTIPIIAVQTCHIIITPSHGNR